MESHLEIDNATRSLLKKPLGKLIRKEKPLITDLLEFIENPPKIVTVGDVTTLNILTVGISPSIAIIDKHAQRQPFLGAINYLIGPSFKTKAISNPSGCISYDALAHIKSSFEDTTSSYFVVEGEEDLLTLPSVAFSPLDSIVFYGQPNEGLVVIQVDDHIKNKSLEILKKIGFQDEFLI